LLAVRNLSASGLAAQLGVSRQYLSQVLAGQRKLSLKCSKRLIDFFGANVVSEIVDWGAMKIENPFKGGAYEGA